MKTRLHDDFEDLQTRIKSGKASPEDIKWLIDVLDAYVDSYVSISEMASRNAKEHAHFRDFLKTQLEGMKNANNEKT